MPFISEVPTIFIQRFYTGWHTLRNQLVTPIRAFGRRIIELYDAMIAGNDFEITPQLTLRRRYGHTQQATIGWPAMYIYSWKSNTQGTIPVIDTTQDVEYLSNSGTVNHVIKNKTSGAGLGIQSSILGIGDYLYVGNPQLTFKYDGPQGTQGVTNWGISSSSTSTGPNTAGTGANSGGLGTVWTNPGNVTSAVSYATITVAASPGYSVWLEATNFGFTIPSTSNIIGFTVTCNASVSVAGKLTMSLMKGGNPLLQQQTVPASSTPGSVTVNWTITGGTFSPSDVNNAGFGCAFSANGNGTTAQVRNVQITVLTGSTPTATPSAGAGTFSAVNGYSYVIAYGNSASGEISNASPVSANTGAFTSKAYVGVAVTASTDSQVNQIHVYRTTDSGGGNQFFEISNSPFANTSTTIQDTTPDTSLSVTSQAEINLGNTPPPSGLTNLEWFSGRMWGSVNNLLYASTGPETLSGTAPNSNWNPTFQWVIPQPIVRNIRGPNGMLVFTIDDCYIVRGTDIVNYTVNEFVKNFGVRTYNAIDTDGTNMYVFTSDRQFICINASGAQDVGLPISDQLLNVDPTQVYVTVHRYALDALVRILDTVNNVFYDYNLNQQCWNLPGIPKMLACTAMGDIEVTPGNWQLIVQTLNSGINTLARRVTGTYTDLGVSYSPTAVFGTWQLADPGTLAKFGGRGGMCIEQTNAGSQITLSILFNDIGATLSNAVGSQITGTFVGFNSTMPKNGIPTLADGPVNYRSLYYYMTALKTRVSAYVRHMQFQITAPAENTATEILGIGIFGDQKMEVESAAQPLQPQGR